MHNGKEKSQRCYKGKRKTKRLTSRDNRNVASGFSKIMKMMKMIIIGTYPPHDGPL
jgi:hypothetical protein